jgi:hypothetical protein
VLLILHGHAAVASSSNVRPRRVATAASSFMGGDAAGGGRSKGARPGPRRLADVVVHACPWRWTERLQVSAPVACGEGHGGGWMRQPTSGKEPTQQGGAGGIDGGSPAGAGAGEER